MIYYTAISILLLTMGASVPFNKTAFPVFQSFVGNLCANKVSLDETACSTVNSTTEPIVCDEDGNLIAINFNRKPCQGGFITSDIAQLYKLQTLDLRDSLIGGSIPTQIGYCKSLTSLLTAGNNLRGLVPQELVYLRLSYCTLMRNVAESNCFDCPVPKLICTATLRCNATCLVGSTTATLTTSQTTLSTTTASSSQQSSGSTTNKPYTEQTTTSTLLTSESEIESYQSTTTTKTTAAATTKTYQQKTQTLRYDSETKTTQSEGASALLSSPQQSNGNVSLIIGLSFALGVTVPVILVLLCLYGKSKRTRRIPPIMGVDIYANNKKSDDLEVRMNVVSGNYGSVAARNGTNYNAVEVHAKKHNVQYDVVPVQSPGEYDSVQSVLVE